MQDTEHLQVSSPFCAYLCGIVLMHRQSSFICIICRMHYVNAQRESVSVRLHVFYLQKPISMKFDIGLVTVEGYKINLISVPSDPVKALFACIRLNLVTYYTRWFKYDRDCLCVNKSQFVPVIFEPPCIIGTFIHKPNVKYSLFLSVSVFIYIFYLPVRYKRTVFFYVLLCLLVCD
jgi:hypothetical protein